MVALAAVKAKGLADYVDAANSWQADWVRETEEVVTIDFQDGVSASQTAAVFEEVGLSSPAAGTIRAPELERVRDFVVRFLEYHLESRPRSYRGFLAVPNRNRPRTPAR